MSCWEAVGQRRIRDACPVFVFMMRMLECDAHNGVKKQPEISDIAADFGRWRSTRQREAVHCTMFTIARQEPATAESPFASRLLEAPPQT